MVETLIGENPNNPKPGVLDMCDSIVIALAGVNSARKDKDP